MARKDTHRIADGLDSLASPIHKHLGMSPAQVRQELVDAGLDPAAEVAAMRRLGRVLEAKYRPRADREAVGPSAAPRPARFFRDAVAAGPAEWTTAERWDIEDALFAMLGPAPEGSYWVRISGDSMKDVQIGDGDWVLIDPSVEAKDGDIVLAHLAGLGQVVKRLRIADGGTRLESANDAYAPIPVSECDAMKIHGVAIQRAGVV